MALPNTTVALGSIMANQRFSQGVHGASHIEVGSMGVVLGDTEYDPVRHSPTDINPLSLLGEATGMDYVQQVVPEKPLDIRVIADFGDTDDDSRIARQKIQATRKFTSELTDAMPSITDYVHSFVIGAGDHIHARIGEGQMLGIESSDIERAEQVAKFCLQGLSFVISDFRHLPLMSTGHQFDETIAVKLNHPLERKIPGGIGIISLGRGFEVDTDRDKQLSIVNEKLEERHQATVTALETVGLQVASIVLDPYKHDGINYEETDNATAEALNRLR